MKFYKPTITPAEAAPTTDEFLLSKKKNNYSVSGNYVYIPYNENYNIVVKGNDGKYTLFPLKSLVTGAVITTIPMTGGQQACKITLSRSTANDVYMYCYYSSGVDCNFNYCISDIYTAEM